MPPPSMRSGRWSTTICAAWRAASSESERSDHTLQRTALVNEAFIRLSGQRSVEWLNREQFLSLTAKIMRQVLVDYARQRDAQRRGDGAAHLSMHDTRAALEVDEIQALAAFEDDRVDVEAIDTALLRLEEDRSSAEPDRGAAVLWRSDAGRNGGASPAFHWLR